MHQIDLGTGVVALGHHQGFDIGPGQVTFDRELEILDQLSPRKRSEWLASRELLFRIAKLPERAECLYDEFGKPYLIGSNRHISVSHSASWASAMICDQSCGVDIQVYSNAVERIANKFLSENEIKQTLKSKNRLHHLHLLWGAKECMYKAYGKKKLEFRQHIFIHTLDIDNCTGKGEISIEDIHLQYEIHFRILPEAAWVFCILSSPASSDRF